MKSRRLTGFTLLEILLVLVLMSIMAVVVVPTMAPPKNEDAKLEAQRFYQLIQLWTEQSLLTGQTLGLRIEKDTYQLLRLASKDWESVELDRTTTSVTLPEGVEMELEVTGFVAEEDRLFDRGGLFDDEMFVEEDAKPKPPQVVLMGNGEIISFSLTFMADKKRLWLVKGNDVATFEIEPLDEGRE